MRFYRLFFEKMRRAKTKKEFNAPIQSGRAPYTESAGAKSVESWVAIGRTHAEGWHGSIRNERNKHGTKIGIERAFMGLNVVVRTRTSVILVLCPTKNQSYRPHTQNRRMGRPATAYACRSLPVSADCFSRRAERLPLHSLQVRR